VLKQARPGIELEAGWQSFKNGEVRKLGAAIEGDLGIEQLLATSSAARLELNENQNLGNALHGLLKRLRAGKFGPRPQDCKYCDYQRVCRLSDRRLSAEGEGDGP
jgi:hypothetical protein